MHDSKQRAVRFLEKEIETYTALSLFLSKKGVRAQLRSGTSEILNWITAAGALEGLAARVIDYIPGYRSPAGTGAGMAFVLWE